jgi:hypothetical protein
MKCLTARHVVTRFVFAILGLLYCAYLVLCLFNPVDKEYNEARKEISKRVGNSI